MGWEEGGSAGKEPEKESTESDPQWVRTVVGAEVARPRSRLRPSVGDVERGGGRTPWTRACDGGRGNAAEDLVLGVGQREEERRKTRLILGCTRRYCRHIRG